MARKRDPLTFAEFRERFNDEAKCRAWLERIRWPDGPVCPRCGIVNRASRITTRVGRYTCLECGHRFTVTSGTAMHSTRVPLCDWLLVMYLFSTSSKGVSANKLSQWLDIQYRTVWHLCHRVRAMMAAEPGWLKGIVEVDETYVGGKPRPKNRENEDDPKPPSDAPTGRGTKRPMVGVAVERKGKAKIAPLGSHGAEHLAPFVWKNVDRGAVLATDELPAYDKVGSRWPKAHIRVNHSAGQYATDDAKTGLRAHVNTAESVNATLKRSIIGVWHWISAKHRGRYATEVQFRWNARQDLFDSRLDAMAAFGGRHLPLKELFA